MFASELHLMGSIDRHPFFCRKSVRKVPFLSKTDGPQEGNADHAFCILNCDAKPNKRLTTHFTSFCVRKQA